MEPLQIVWFGAIAALWIGYLLLEGFDLGVGMLMLVGVRGDAEQREQDRRVMLNTIGPVWDGNEVWLITAGAAIFAAFPLWYASLFSTLYVALTLVLLGLIMRAVAIEYRGKRNTDRWRTMWTWALGLGSFVSAFGIGAALALTTTGLPINEYGDREGGPLSWFSLGAVLGGLGVVGFSIVHAQAFLALKSDGPVRERANRFARSWGLLLLLPIVGWVLQVQFLSGSVWSWALVVVAVLALVGSIVAAFRRREGWTFVGMCGFLVAGAAAIFTAAFPVVIPSTLDPAFDLTIMNASSSSYTLGVMTIVASFGLPLVLAYQAWSYWVFRRRVGPESIPAAHTVTPAVHQDA
ncbi:cytochrome d ubiquinol oxidase subunit II [Pseudoclavibacter chungangensis]|uniref:Cytochrome d ubiquinol oxidase subunit II n=1 Tax=Pseudoclavibacter chungangensis TaxID=587635 RepID=A0A7J5BM40_9MICO|nr:cytochrome d ubiquinol oxidase subunit II [Pseudoclavibacter chungangensis]KAB1652155.1 cytochrome d ubiquinol oxidase subunit II [Pseudoclavibacter chungangensis]NYJ68680.1 cytochrome d ubiquinol oxidase subunit II [Pseudoclavibacter chungangensis]